MNLYRPIYHFIPEKNWMNDPNGPIFYNGQYHLFYQYNPNDYHWATMHWGHAVSEDLVHWRHLPIALYPSNELGETHCFSGCTVINDEGYPTILYTSIGENERDARDGGEQWTAISYDDMLTWEKHNSNPIMEDSLHGEIDIKEWRDPFVWKEGGLWYMVLGGEHDEKGCILIYSSEDLIDWKFLNIMFETPRFKFLECPNMLKFGDKYVLVYSPNSEVRYHVGTLNSDFTFKTEYEGIIDNSGREGFYAPNTLTDPYGRKVMWGWMTEDSRGEFQGAQGWAGAQSIPRVLILGKDNRLRINPISEYKTLRYNEEAYENMILEKNTWHFKNRGRALEIEMDIRVNGDEELSLNVLESPDNKEKTTVRFNAAVGEITVDRTKSSLSQLPHKGSIKAGLKVEKDQVVNIRVFIDHSIIEVFANGEACLSTRIYPTLEDSCNVSMELNKGEKLNVKRLNIWKMNSIW